MDEDDNAFLADVPGPFAGLLGLRVERPTPSGGRVNPVVLSGTAHEARHVFEVVVPEDAEVLATYGADFYAGTPAVTRPARCGQCLYVATLLTTERVGAVVDGVLAEHGLAGRWPTCGRRGGRAGGAERHRYAFVLNHGAERW
ncbi:beta-galactosidase trimerization domain-containing protein [Saccharothrix sp. MB29]|nr:beta-galactosidase trimerization domain-containing protein [Saccharothrix sp. MB29]